MATPAAGVAPEVRRQGVGARLLADVESWARHRGAREIWLEVTEVNLPAIKFYQRCGFEFTGNTIPYPNDPSIRELEMIRRLTDHRPA
jgi:ribosomal protein S18 acetylase RimI-like enzyme